MKHKTYLAIFPLVLLLTAACSETKEMQEETATKVTEPVTTETETPETQLITELPTEPSGGINPLTGETGYPEEAAGKRPVAVMVNNLAQAYPQYGTSQADILYEIPVEGGVTRMMAVYADQDSVPDVGSVRSARYYFPRIAMGMDAIYCHWGAEQLHAVATMDSLRMDHFDGSDLEHSILFYRDPERVGVYSSEHTGYLRGSDIPAVLERFGTRRYAASRDTAFSFAETARVPAGSPCTRAAASFSDSSRTGFIYDAQAQVYLVDHNGTPQMDGHAGTQLAFTNVFILQTEVSYLDETEYLRRVELEGGEGYYISMGGMENIRWEKQDDRSPITYYTLSGDELTVNPGKSYIGLVSAARRQSFDAG